MAYEDIQVFLSSFSDEMDELEKRFKVDSNHLIFQCYIPMVQNIRKKAHAYLNPTLKEFELIAIKYGEKYKMKDLDFHVKQAVENLNMIKTILKEILDLYESQSPYPKIAEKWERAFSGIDKRIQLINSRMLLIEKILKDEY